MHTSTAARMEKVYVYHARCAYTGRVNEIFTNDTRNGYATGLI